MKKRISIILCISFIFSIIAPMDCIAEQTQICNVEDEAVFDTESYLDFSEELTELYREFDTKENWEEKTEDSGEDDWENTYQTARIIVKSNTSLSDDRAIASAGPFDDCYVFQYRSPWEAKEACEAYQTREGIIYAEPDGILSVLEQQVQLTSTVSLETERDLYDWGRNACHFSALQKLIENAGSNAQLPEIIVADIDTGVYVNHEVFENRLTRLGYNVVGDESGISDQNGHGTAVASIIALNTPANVKIMPIKAFSDDGKTTNTLSIASGIRYAVINGAKIINMSFGGPLQSQSKFLKEQILYAQKQGVLLTGAYGNDGVKTTDVYPACYDGVIGVSAITEENKLADFSNYGEKVSLSAPGADVFLATIRSSTAYSSDEIMPGTRAVYNGTSYATPYVSAAAAMIMTLYPELSANQVTALLFEHATDLGTIGKDIYYGYGSLNLSSFDIEHLTNSYRVTFEENGGTDVSPQTVSYGSHINAPTTTRSGYHMLGWYLEPECLTKAEISDLLVFEDIKLYAKWEKHSYLAKKKKVVIAPTYTKDGKACYCCDVCGNEGKIFSVSYRKLSAPVVTSIVNQSKGVFLTWKKVTGATGYYVYRKDNKNAGFKKVATLHSKSQNQYLDKKVKEGASVTYVVKAYNPVQKSSKKKTYTFCYQKQMVLSPKAKTKHTVTIAWKKKAACDGYQIRYSSSSRFTPCKTLRFSQNTKSGIIRNCKSKTNYYVQIRSYRKINGKKYYGAWSKVIKIKTK